MYKWQDATKALAAWQEYTAKTQYRNKYYAATVPISTCIYVGERLIYSHDRFAYSAAGKYVDRSWEYINRRHMNVKIGTEAAQIPEKEYINGIYVAVY